LLITLLETSTRTSVTTEGLSLKPFPLGIHLLALVIHHDSVVHKRLKNWDKYWTSAAIVVHHTIPSRSGAAYHYH
jgi:hypothetical protein